MKKQKKQSPNKPPRKPRSALKQSQAPNSRLVQFPQATGKTVEKVELSTDSAFPCISIRFQDNTDLTVKVDSWLTFRADYSRWKKGNQKVLKRWPVFRSNGM